MSPFIWSNNNIIIKIFITSAALSKIRRAAGTCHSVLTKRYAFRRRAKVAVDSVDRRSSAGKLFQVSGPETAKFPRPMAVAVRCTSSFEGSGLCTSCERVHFFLVFLDPKTELPACLSNVWAWAVLARHTIVISRSRGRAASSCKQSRCDQHVQRTSKRCHLQTANEMTGLSLFSFFYVRYHSWWIKMFIR